MTAPPPLITNFRQLERNTLKGFFDLELPSGMILAGCALHEKGDKYWIGLPSKPYTAGDGTQSWTKIVDFRDAKTRNRFQETVAPLAIEALERAKAGAAA